VSDSLCPICECEEETLLHVLWSCPAARDVWGSGPNSMQKCEIMEVDFLGLLCLMVERCDKDELQNMAAKKCCYFWGGLLAISIML
jgi:hypothetical protein